MGRVVILLSATDLYLPEGLGVYWVMVVQDHKEIHVYQQLVMDVLAASKLAVVLVVEAVPEQADTFCQVPPPSVHADAAGTLFPAFMLKWQEPVEAQEHNQEMWDVPELD